MTASRRPQPLREDQGRALLRLARSAIARRLHSDPSAHASAGGQGITGFHELAGLTGGSFVTLTVHGALRGCIGSFVDEPLADGVSKNAVNAAFGDPRFPPLSIEELEKVHIEVSVLSPSEPLPYEQPMDLPRRLLAGEVGVVIRKGAAQATFLPQVWKQLPNPEAFLTHLCMKAGLSADAWRKETLSVEVYRVQSFEEEARTDGG